MAELVGWIVYDGMEIANAARTLAYVRAGLAGSRFIAGSSTACDCPEQTIGGPWSTPAADPAPWYSATHPESAHFYGFLPESVTTVPRLSRSQTATGTSGVSLGPLALGARLVAVTGVLVASTPAGMEYGERWLSQSLAGSCGDCSLGDLCLIPACPEGVGYENSAFRTMHRVGVVDWVPPAGFGPSHHYLRRASFQFASELPWWYADAVPCASAANASTGPVSCTTTADDFPGDATLAIEVYAGGPDPVGPVKVSVIPRRTGETRPCGPGGMSDAIGWWRAHDHVDATSTVPDLTGHGHNLVSYQGPAPSATVGGARFLRYAGEKYLYLPGRVTDYADAPDSATTSPLGDQTWQIDAALDDWSRTTNYTDFISKADTSQIAFFFRYNHSLSVIEWIWSTNGTATIATTVAIPRPADGERRVFRVSIDVDNGAAGNTVRFYELVGGAAVLIGTTVTASTTSVFNSTAKVTIGGRDDEAGPVGAKGRIYSAKGWSDITQTTAIVNFVPDTQAASPWASQSDGISTWTYRRSTTGLAAALVDRTVMLFGGSGAQLYVGAADAFTHPSWRPQAGDSFTVVVAGRVFGAGDTSILASHELSAGAAYPGWRLAMGTTGPRRPEAYLADGAVQTTVVETSTPAGEVHGWAFRRSVSADAVQIVEDSTQIATGTDTTTGAPSDTTTVLRFGALGDNTTTSGYEWIGAAYFARALTTSEVAAVIAQLQLTTAEAFPPACWEATIPTVPAGHTLRIDGSRRTVELRAPGGTVVGGFETVDPVGYWSWPDLEPCVVACVTVDPAAAGADMNADTTVTIERYQREL